jgi:hypothetical protein
MYTHTNPTGYTKPRQKVSTGAKTKKWADETAEYYRGVCVDAVDKEEALRNYRLANGELDESEYLYVTNPLNTDRPELMGAPARLMNYDIISPNFNLLMGEKVRRQFPPIVYAKNNTYQLEKLKEQHRLYVRELQKMFVNEAIAQGVQLEEEQLGQSLEQIAAKIQNLPDELSRLGQDTLEYVMDLNQMPRKFREGFYDWLCQACVYTYKDVFKDKTVYENWSPIHIAYLCSPTKPFIQDGEAVKATCSMSANEIYDRFQDDPDWNKELEDYINSYAGDSSSSTRSIYGYRVGATDVDSARRELSFNLFGRNAKEDYANGIDVEHLMWRSQTQRGTLIVPDPFGGPPQEITVSDDFKPVEGEIVHWRWEDEIWENYKIGDRYWIGARVVPIQNEKKANLLYNGRNMLSRHTRPKPLVKRGEAYQKTVNIIKYRAELTLAKNLDHLILFPLGLIPKKEGWDEDTLMYYARSFSFLFYDDTRPNASQMIQAMKDLNVSALQHVIQAYNLVQIVKQEWDESCGINPQRKGEVGASAGKAVTQDAQDRSYIMSEEMFLEYEEFEREEYEGMLEISKFAFSGGLQANFVRQDGTNAFLNLHDPTSFINTDLGVFVKNGRKELAKLELLRGNAQAFAQNQVDPKAISEIIEAENYGKIHQIMDGITMKMDAQRQQDIGLQQEQIASEERVANAQLEFQYYNADLVSATDVHVALIEEGMAQADSMRKLEASGQTSSPEYGALQANMDKNFLELTKNATKIKDIASKERMKGKEIAAKERMNKDNNRVALKNKVAGEA